MESPGSLSVQIGDQLPGLDIPLTTGSIIAGAMATRDWQDVHHDRERAQASGLRDIIVSIPTTVGYVARFVTNWAGPRAVLRSNKVRLGASACPGDTLRCTGSVVGKQPDGLITVEVKLATASAVHANGEVTLTLASPGEQRR